jgi:hypothetical protein
MVTDSRLMQVNTLYTNTEANWLTRESGTNAHRSSKLGRTAVFEYFNAFTVLLIAELFLLLNCKHETDIS